MSDQPTQNLGNGNSFEERLMLRLDAIDARLQTLEARAQEQAQERVYDTRPILERILKEVADQGVELREIKAGLVEVKERLTRVEERQTALEERQAAIEKEVRHYGRKLDMFNEELLEIRWALRDFEKRLNVPEAELA